MNEPEHLEPLSAFLERLPAMDLPAGRTSIGAGITDDGLWWVKFSVDTKHPLAWRVVQELGHLSWVIENQAASLTPADCARWLQGRLPDPVTDLDAWAIDEDAG